MMIEQEVENIRGNTIDQNLRETYKLILPGTMHHVDQLIAERRTNLRLRDLGFYTADGMVYFLDGDTPKLAITREEVNPVLKNIDNAFEQLITKKDYPVSPADFEAVKAASDTVTIDLNKLRLQKKSDNDYSHFTIDTSKDIASYNTEQQKLLRRVYGPTDEDYSTNMEMLKTSASKITETYISILNPKYIQKHAKRNPIGLTSWLDNFVFSFFLNAAYISVSYEFYLRGVRREVSAAGASAQKS